MTAINENGDRQTYIWTDKSIPDSGERMIVLSWKQTAKMEQAGKVAHTKRFVSAPALSVAAVGEYAVFVETMLTQLQKEFIQEYVGNELDAQGGGNGANGVQTSVVVPGEFFQVASLLERWEESQGNTLSEESVKAWFAEHGFDALTLAFLERIAEANPGMNGEEAEKRAKQSAAQYGAVFCQLAGEKGIEKDNLMRMKKALGFMENDTGVVGRRVVRRIEKLLNAGKGFSLEDL